MHISMYAHFPNSLGQEKSDLSKPLNRNLMKNSGTGKDFSGKMSYHLVKLSSRDTK